MSDAASAARHTVRGTFRVTLADALMFPTGFAVFLFLGRSLGPSVYGIYTLAATVVVWVEWGVVALFDRAAIRLVGGADDWRPLGASLVRLHLLTGACAGLALSALAGPLAALLREPSLAGHLRLFALDVPLFALAQAHKQILVGTGDFDRRAQTGAVRWTVKLLLSLLLVSLGLSVSGAILANLGASVLELAVARRGVRPPLFAPVRLPPRRLWEYALPLFLGSLFLRVFGRMDLFALKALGGTAAQAGVYNAAQNLAMVPAVIGFSFSPLLLSTLARAQREGNGDLARKAARHALRLAFWLLPFAALAAVAAPRIVGHLLGRPYLSAAPVLAVLILASAAHVTLSVSTSILTAADRPGWVLALSIPLVPVALAGYFLAIPALGPPGAAMVNGSVSLLAAMGGLALVRRIWGVLPPAGTVARSFLVTLSVAFIPGWPAGAAAFWGTFALAGAGVVLLLALLGEFSPRDLAALRGLFAPAQAPGVPT